MKKGLYRAGAAVALGLAAAPSAGFAQSGQDTGRAIINGLFGQPQQRQAGPTGAGRGQYDTPPGVQPKGPINLAGCEGIEVVRYNVDNGMGPGLRIYFMVLRNTGPYEKMVSVFVERADAPAYARKVTLNVTVAPVATDGCIPPSLAVGSKYAPPSASLPPAALRDRACDGHVPSVSSVSTFSPWGRVDEKLATLPPSAAAPVRRQTTRR